ncbi:unnamed protein product [Lampetra planeri]
MAPWPRAAAAAAAGTAAEAPRSKNWCRDRRGNAGRTRLCVPATDSAKLQPRRLRVSSRVYFVVFCDSSL